MISPISRLISLCVSSYLAALTTMSSEPHGREGGYCLSFFQDRKHSFNLNDLHQLVPTVVGIGAWVLAALASKA